MHRAALDRTFRIDLLVGADIREHIRQLAALRIAVFREYPYLYLGDAASEEKYLARFLANPRALLVLVRDADGTAVGASTAQPLADELPELRAPFERAGLDPADYCYFGESVLLPAWRGHRLGHCFFDIRESHARQLGLMHATFCAVERPEDHPRRPVDYRPLDAFWATRGYQRSDTLLAKLEWRDLDEVDESPKPMRFWTRAID